MAQTTQLRSRRQRPTTLTSSSSSSSSFSLAGAHANEQIYQSVQRTLQRTLENRPSNTKVSYNPKVQEYRNWCDSQYSHEPPETRYLVFGDKIHFFLEKEVVNRRKRKPGRKPKNTVEEPEDDNVERGIVGTSLVESYINALVDLWSQQVNNRSNCHPHPRYSSAALRQLVDNVDKEKAKRRKQNYEDKAKMTLVDGYTNSAQLKSVLQYFRNNSKAFLGLSDSTIFLLSHALTLRGGNARDLELSDLFSVELESELGSPKCLIALFDHVKTNSVGRVQ